MAVSKFSTRANQWRRENPNALRQWPTAYGTVSQFWGMRVYCGRCKDCGAPVHTRRNVARHNLGSTNIGRWPALCDECREGKARKYREIDSERARKRMADRRRWARELRDGDRAECGLPPVRQGIKPETNDKYERLYGDSA